MRRWLGAAIAAAFLIAVTVGHGQPTAAPCGVVDAIDYPIDIADTLREGYDDFAQFRARFGGNHVGIDIGFNRWGDPVFAAARGRVTYSDLFAWDTEKGVVIVEHTFPDGSTAYTLYGHMEQGDAVFFPTVGECVERGAILGLIGWPSRGLPHLHYEIRSFLPDDGGPGYVTGNPVLTGWYHPLDFTQLWRVRLQTGFLGAAMYTEIPSLPPALIDSGVTVISSGSTLAAFNAAGGALWRVSTAGAITGLSALPGDRVAARGRDGQTVVLSASTGRYLAVWTVAGLDTGFITSGDALLFLTDGGGVAAYSAVGDPLWTLPPDPVLADTAALRVVHFERGAASSSGNSVAVGLRADGGTRWRVIDPAGSVLYAAEFSTAPTFAPLPSGGWLALDGAALERIAPDAAGTWTRTEITRIAPPAGRTARLISDIVGNSYLYSGDSSPLLLAIDPHGGVRWRVPYPAGASALSPVLAIGGGCTLYTLDADGMLNAFSTSTGMLISQRQLYAGGVQNGSPRARLLRVDAAERVQVSAGFLSALLLDGHALGEACLLG